MKKVTPIRAIRAKCLDCCCYQTKEVRLCSVLKCPLYPYRMGHRPKKDGASLGFSEESEEDDDMDDNEEVKPIGL